MESVTFENMSALVSSSDPRRSLVVDVRSPEEFSAGRLPISVNIPLPGLEEALAMGPELFQQKFGVNKPDLGDNIVVMCRCNNNYVSFNYELQ